MVYIYIQRVTSPFGFFRRVCVCVCGLDVMNWRGGGEMFQLMQPVWSSTDEEDSSQQLATP